MKKLILLLFVSGVLSSCTQVNKDRTLSSDEKKSYNVTFPIRLADRFTGEPDFFDAYEAGGMKHSAANIIDKLILKQRYNARVKDEIKNGAPLSFKEYLKWTAKSFAIAKGVKVAYSKGKNKPAKNSNLFKTLTMLDWLRNNPINLFEQIRNGEGSKATYYEDGFFVTSGVPNIMSYYEDGEKLPTGEKAEYRNSTVMIVQADDVREALNHATFENSLGEQDKVFSVALYNPKMDMSVGSEYMLASEFGFTREEKGVMRDLMKREHKDIIKDLAKKFTKDAIERSIVKGNSQNEFGHIEIVNSVARRVSAEITKNYFGFTADLRSIMRWSRATQKSFFHNPTNDFTHELRAKEAGEEMREYVRSMIVAYHSGNKDVVGKDTIFRGLLEMPIPKSLVNTVRDNSYADVTARLIDKQCKSGKGPYRSLGISLEQCVWYERVVANVIGTLVGGIETTQAAIVQTVDFFLDNPNIKESVVAAAEKGDHDTVAKYVWEALRFRPINPVVLRYVQKDYKFPKSKRKVRKGDIAMIATQSAMFDEDFVTDPYKFIPGRGSVNGRKGTGETRDNAYYFHLGNGSHKCLGDYVAEALVPEVVMGIMALPGLDRVDFTGRGGVKESKKPGLYIGYHDNIGAFQKFSTEDTDPSTFPEHLVLKTSLTPKEGQVTIADPRFMFEDYLIDYDKVQFRSCLSDVSRGTKYSISDAGHLPRNQDGKSVNMYDGDIKFGLKKFGVKSKNINGEITIPELDYVLYNAYYNRHAAGAAADLFYCRLPSKFRSCMQGDKKLFEIGSRYATEFESCSESLSDLEKYFYKTEILSKLPWSHFAKIKDEKKRVALYYSRKDRLEFETPAKLAAGHAAKVKERGHSHYPWEEIVKFYDRADYRQTFMNPMTSKAYLLDDESGANILNFYTRVDLAFRKCNSLSAFRKSSELKSVAQRKDGINKILFWRHRKLSQNQESNIQSDSRNIAYESCTDEAYHLPDYMHKYMKSMFVGVLE